MKFEIPKRFKIGGVEHSVTFQRTVGDNCDFGQWDSVGTITIAEMVGADKVTPSRQRQTFWHELTHAILNAMRKDELNEDESFVNTFASFLSGAIDTMETDIDKMENDIDKIAAEAADKYCNKKGCGHISPNDWDIAHDCIKIGYNLANGECLKGRTAKQE